MTSLIQDIESYHDKPLMIDETKIKLFVKDLIKVDPSKDNIEITIVSLRKKYKIIPTKNQMRYIYEKYFIDTPINTHLSSWMILKSMRSRSGVLVSTIVLKPSAFSCPKKCAYCPTETDLNGNFTQPKSYLSSEPAMLRALQYKFDVRGQIWDRIVAYIKTGNITNLDKGIAYKLEIIVSGGTWESYPLAYRNTVMQEIYWAANIFNKERPILSLEEEIKINETEQFRIIGLTIETRPDFINVTAIKDYRRCGVTRIQIGVQHYDDNILELIKRDCTTADTIKAIRMLKECGFKVVCHLMPDLPGSSPELDRMMLMRSIVDSDLQFDDVKIYPTAICKSNDPNIIVTSDINTWYEEGSYKPYAETDLRPLINILKEYKQMIQPWVRIQRLVRDIPRPSIEAGYNKMSNLRQMIQDEMKKENIQCNCIRCMEVDDRKVNSPVLVVRKYIASEGIEYFISYESYKKLGWNYTYYIISNFFSTMFCRKKLYWNSMKNRDAIFGFCRLRIDKNPGGGYIKELDNCAMIREVHVYGSSLGINMKTADMGSQHKGYGQKLVAVAEEIALSHNINKVAVIAGVGTREYYKNKCGYTLEGSYMIKNIKNINNIKNYNFMLIMTIIRCILIILSLLFLFFM